MKGPPMTKTRVGIALLIARLLPNAGMAEEMEYLGTPAPSCYLLALKGGCTGDENELAGFDYGEKRILIALALIVLGFGLKYRELSAKEQANAIQLLDQELPGNLKIIG
jgi:hypothetical protein